MAIPFTRGVRARSSRHARSVSNPRTRARSGSFAWTRVASSLTALTIVLLLIGLVFVASSSSVYSLHRHQDSWHVFRRQVLWVVMGSVGLIGATVIPYKWLPRLGVGVFGVSVFMTLLTLTGFGHTRNGSSRWIGPTAVQIQPSEFVKMGLALVLALQFHFAAKRINDLRKTVRPTLLLWMAGVGPILLQPDLGTAIVCTLIVLSMFAVSGMSPRLLAAIWVPIGLLGMAYAYLEPYRRDRIFAFLNPTSDLSNVGYHVWQSKIGFSSGGFWGVGVGGSRAKWGFVPNAHTDFIYAVIGEELGLIGSMLMLGLFFTITLMGIRAARRSSDRFGMLLATGLTTWIVSQALINMGAVIGAMPVTGVPMPFVSVGGSSLVVLMAAMGVLINIARNGRSETVDSTSVARRSRRVSSSEDE